MFRSCFAFCIDVNSASRKHRLEAQMARAVPGGGGSSAKQLGLEVLRMFASGVGNYSAGPAWPSIDKSSCDRPDWC